EKLGRRRSVVERTWSDTHWERIGHTGGVPSKVAARDRTANPLEIRANFATNVTAIEIVKACTGELIQCLGERDLHKLGVDIRGASIYEKCLSEPWGVF